MLSTEEALERAPGLEDDGLTGAALYFDAQVEYAERLAIENAIDAARARGRVAHLLPRRPARTGGQRGRRRDVHRPARWRRAPSPGVDDGERHRSLGGRHPSVTRRSRNDPLLSCPKGRGEMGWGGGGGRPSRSARTSSPPASGSSAASWPQWRPAGPDAARLIGGTKGSHIIVERFPGAPRDALYVEARSDGRPFFIIPWNHLFLIGTTDVSLRRRPGAGRRIRRGDRLPDRRDQPRAADGGARPRQGALHLQRHPPVAQSA